MKKIIVIVFSLFLLHKIIGTEAASQVDEPLKILSVDEWYQKVKDRNPNPKKPQEPSIVTFEEFKKLLEKYLTVQKKFLLDSSWVGQKINVENPTLQNDFKDELDEPFALKLSVNSGASVYFWGDLHGDVAALAIALKKLKDRGVIDDAFTIIAPDTYCIFLGDMVDRGAYQFDLLSLLLMFATKNTGKVFLIRGNHEDLSLSDRYGFSDQLSKLYKQNNPQGLFNHRNPIYSSISLLYNLMPDVAFVGCNNNYLQCCHGGIEIRYNPKELLADADTLSYQLIKKPVSFESEPFLKKIIDPDGATKLNIEGSGHRFFSGISHKLSEPFEKSNFGFLWGDFNNNPVNNYSTFFKGDRGLFAGKDFTQDVLKYYSTDKIHMRGIMRAHQHNLTLPGILDPENSGIFSLWDNTVITNLSTSLITGIVAFNEINFFKNYDEWRLTNFSFSNSKVVEEKKALLKEWTTRQETKPAPEVIQQKSVTEHNADLIQKIYNEIEKVDPNYQDIKAWIKDIKKDPDNKNSMAYITAQSWLSLINKLTNAIGFFNKKDYDLAESALRYLLYEPLIKFKAREYYAKTVIADRIQDSYYDAFDALQTTLYDPESLGHHHQAAESLIADLQDLMQPEEEIT